MRSILGAAAALTLLPLGACDGGGTENRTAAAGPVTTNPASGWLNVVTQTPDGGMRMGNPEAPVKVIEFASLACPHCAAFSELGARPLQEKYVSTGNVSFEIRPIMMGGHDLAATLLARCNGPAPFFKLSEQMFSEQNQWLGKLQQLPPAEAQRISTLPPEQQVAAFARAAGLDQFVRQRGIPEAKAQACLTDRAAIDRLVAMQTEAMKEYQIPGTPTFVINGEVAEGATTWAELEPLIRGELS